MTLPAYSPNDIVEDSDTPQYIVLGSLELTVVGYLIPQICKSHC